MPAEKEEKGTRTVTHPGPSSEGAGTAKSAYGRRRHWNAHVVPDAVPSQVELTASMCGMIGSSAQGLAGQICTQNAVSSKT